MIIELDCIFTQKTEISTQFITNVKQVAIFNKQVQRTIVFDASIGQISSYLLKEDGFFLLTESGFKLIVE